MNYFKMKIKFVKMFVKPCPLFLLSLFSFSPFSYFRNWENLEKNLNKLDQF